MTGTATVNNEAWQSQTPSNTLELGSQSALVKTRIQRHIDSSPTSIVEAFEKVSQGAAIITHKLVLAQQEVAELRAANEAATRPADGAIRLDITRERVSRKHK